MDSVAWQVWATWLFYAVLVDLTDAVADELKQPFAAVSLEMVYCSLYFFTQAYYRGEATDVVKYLAENASWLGLLKRKRKSSSCFGSDNGYAMTPSVGWIFKHRSSQFASGSTSCCARVQTSPMKRLATPARIS